MKKRIFAILVLMLILTMNFTMVFASGWSDLDNWDQGASQNGQIAAASTKISGIGLAVEYVMNNAFKMLVTLIITYISIKLIFTKSGQSADASKQKIAAVVIAVLIYTLGVPVLNMLGSSFYGLF
ncbi:MAG: hypothetical protein PHN69_06745 [Candidatus Pacebacteria bacterium]|jgi:hypothetical protein|nr:hypothetical protein [Candidatus Paceibacterota bacterium]